MSRPPEHSVALERSKASSGAQSHSSTHGDAAPGMHSELYWECSSEKACAAVSFGKNSSSHCARALTQRIRATRGIAATEESGKVSGGVFVPKRARSCDGPFAPESTAVETIFGPGATMAAKRSLRSVFPLKGTATVRLRFRL